MHRYQKIFSVFKDLWSLLWIEADIDLRRQVIRIFLLVLAIAVFSTVTPLCFKYVIDSLPTSGSAIPILLLMAYIGVQTLGKLGGELRWRVYGRIEQAIRRRLALRLFDHVHTLSLRFHLERKTGALQQIVGNGLLGYSLLLQNALYLIIPLLFELVLMGVVILALGKPAFAIILFTTTVSYLFATIQGINRQRVPQIEAASAQIEASALVTDSYLNYETMKYFGCEQLIRNRVNDTLKRSEEGWLRYYRCRTRTGIAQTICLMIALSATVGLSMFDLSRGAMTVGGFVMVVSYLMQILQPLDSFSFAYREMKTGITYIEQMLELTGERPEAQASAGIKELPPGSGKVAFHQVYFRYEDDAPILEDVSFSIPSGRTVAIVGPSGAGKSTISKLLFRFYDVTEGTITINGHDLKEMNLESIRRAIAVVPQDVVLFHDTLAFNIGLAKPGCSLKEIEEAAELAGIADTITALPQGYDTIVGERGFKLSGGERQRIAIARAVLKHPRIFIFDEATSSLDSITERYIKQNIENLSRHTTTLIITHRLTTIVNADEILVLVNGRIAERGSHESLLAREGVYSTLWKQQQSMAQ